jgi:Holliday junction resolvasome RuvABC endonuclease subunit
VADEGLNIPELNTLLLTFPAKSEGRVEQRVGRIMRKVPGKTHGDVYDFIDSGVIHVDNDSKPLLRQYSQRKKAYRKLRAEIIKTDHAAKRKPISIPWTLPILSPPEIIAIRSGRELGFAIGMDPSFTHFGLVAVDLNSWWPAGMATIETSKRDRKLGLRVADDDTRRLEILLTGIRDFLRTYKPEVICCETPSAGAQSADAMKGLSYAKALAVAAKVFQNVPTVWLLPGEIKERVAGTLTSTKGDVAAIVRAVRATDGRSWAEAAWSTTKGKNEHQYDAAASILAAQNTDLFQMALR